MALETVYVARKHQIIIYVGLLFVIAVYIFEDILIFGRTPDENGTQSLHIIKNDSFQISSKSIQCHSLPSLIIVGPPKSGTTSLMVNLAAYFPNWHRQNIKENGHWYSSLRLNVIRNSSRYDFLMEQIKNGIGTPISDYRFDGWLTEYIWPHSEIMEVKIQFIESLLNRTIGGNFKGTNRKSVLIEKTAFNFYLAHIAIVFAKYFGSTQFGQYSIGQLMYSHHAGTKFIAIMRDPSKRLISWHSMKKSFQNHGKWKKMEVYINKSLNNAQVMELRQLIMERQNEIDDTLIMLKYVSCLYEYARRRGTGPWANMWLGEHMLLAGLDYPMLLLWIHVFKQMNMLRHFRVISFNFMVSHFKEIMLQIKCWVEDGIVAQTECDRVSSAYILNQSVVVEQMNTFATKKSDKVLNLLHDFYEPIKQSTNALLLRYNVVLHPWNVSDAMFSW